MEQPLILDRYRPLAALGTGGHGSVVLAFDTKMARRVAIKRLPLPLDRNGRPAVRAGLSEARTAALLNHPNIVTVHEWDMDADEAFIVMENLDGTSLADLLDETGEPFTHDETAAIIAAVSSAVGFGHANGVLHLDIKPGNVLVAGDGRIKVADFGVSALTDATGRASGTAGTIGYMPPEQLRGQELDERTDGWALAALAYELLTNANPFDADSAEGSLFKIEVADMPLPSEFEPGISPAVDDVLLAALSPDADERYPSALAFARALMPLLGDPEEGRASLAALVSGFVADDIEPEYDRPGLWDRLVPRAGAFRRAGGAAVCGWLGWAGLSAFGLGWAPMAGATALIALAGALAPGLGLALGLAVFAAGVAAAVSLLAGAGVLALGIAFWLGLGRRGQGDALLPAAAPLLAIARCGPAAPLLAGFSFPPLRAALTGGASAVVLLLISAATGGTPALPALGWGWLADPWHAGVPVAIGLETLADPGLLIVLASWMAAAAVCSIGCSRASRLGAAIGTGLGVAIMGSGYALLTSLPERSLPMAGVAIDLVLAAFLMTVIIVLGPPVRAEEE